MSLRWPDPGSARGALGARGPLYTQLSRPFSGPLRGGQQRPQDAETQRAKDVLQACQDKTPTWQLQGQGTTARLPSVCLSTHPSWPSSTHYPVCPSVYLHVSTHTSIPSSVCPSVCWSSIHLSLHLPTSFLLSIHPSMCIFPFIHCASLSRPSSSQTTHPSITHPHLCLSIHALVLTPFQSFGPSIHPPNPPSVCPAGHPPSGRPGR